MDIVVLVLLGAGLIFLDFFIPTFGIMSAAALGMIVWALVLAFRVSAATGWVSLGTTVALLAGELVVAFRLAKRSSFVHTGSVQSDTVPEVMRDTLTGMTARTTTPLRPSGKVTVDGQQYDARCDTAVVDADTEVCVVEVRGRELIVRPVAGAAPRRI